MVSRLIDEVETLRTKMSNTIIYDEVVEVHDSVILTRTGVAAKPLNLVLEQDQVIIVIPSNGFPVAFSAEPLQQSSYLTKVSNLNPLQVEDGGNAVTCTPGLRVGDRVLIQRTDYGTLVIAGKVQANG